MKVKCTICGKEEIIDNETIKELNNIINKYKLKAESYTYFLNKIRNKCLDSDEHSFIFDEDFMKQIQEIVDKDENSLLEISKLRTINERLKKEADELSIKIQELYSEYDFNKDRIKNLDQITVDCENEIQKITENADIEIWK